MPGFYLLGIFTVKKNPWISFLTSLCMVWPENVFLALFTGMQSEQMLCHQECASLLHLAQESGTRVQNTLTSAPQILWVVWAACSRHMLLFVPLSVTGKWPLWVTGKWPPAVLLLGLSSHGWCERGDGQVGKEPLGSHGLPSSVPSLHVLRLYEETHLCWTHCWHGKEGPCLLLVSHSLRPAGGDACVAPPLATQGWVGCEPRRWLCFE